MFCFLQQPLFLQASGRSLDPGNTDMEVKQSNEKNVSFSNTPDYTFATTSSSDFQEVGDAAQSGQEKTMGGFSRLLDTNSGATSWSLTMQSPSLPTQPLMPFSEWNIDFSELRIGIRVGIGRCSYLQALQIHACAGYNWVDV